MPDQPKSIIDADEDIDKIARNCGGCSLEVTNEELGGVAKGKDRRPLWFHRDATCIIKAADVAHKDHQTEMRRIAKEIRDGKDPTSKQLSEPPFAPSSEYSL